MLVVMDYQIQRILANIIQNQDKVKFVDVQEDRTWGCDPETVVTFRMMLPGKEVVKE